MDAKGQMKVVKDELNELLNNDLTFEVTGFNKKTGRVILEIEVHDCDGDWTLIGY